MSGPPAANQLVIGILHRATRISRGGTVHALHMRKHRLNSPEASPCHHRRLFSLGGSLNLIHYRRGHRCTRSISRTASQRRRQHRHHHRHHPHRNSGHTLPSRPKSPLPHPIRVTSRKEVSDVDATLATFMWGQLPSAVRPGKARLPLTLSLAYTLATDRRSALSNKLAVAAPKTNPPTCAR